MISEGLSAITTIGEMAVVEDALKRLIRKQRTAILLRFKKDGTQVGFIQRQKIEGKIVEQKVNGTIKDVKGDYAYVDVVAPIRFAGSLVQIDMGLLHDRFEIVEKVKTELTRGPEDDGAGPGDGNPLPIPLG